MSPYPGRRRRPVAPALRVLTYNIRHGVGSDRRLDLERIARIIESTRADVIGLQEVDDHWGARSAYVDQAAWLADRLGLELVYAPAMTRNPASDGAPPRRYGNALLTSLPIRETQVTALPKVRAVRGPGWAETRSYLSARVDWRGEDIRVIVTHLNPGHVTLRHDAVAALARHLDGDPLPAVLMGDMNDNPSGRAFAPWRAIGLRDAAHELHARPRLPFALGGPLMLGGRTFPARFPMIRLDGVLVRGPWTVDSARVPREPRASDHRPLQVDLRLDGRPADAP